MFLVAETSRMKGEKSTKRSDQILEHESWKPTYYPVCPQFNTNKNWDFPSTSSPFWDDVTKYVEFLRASLRKYI